jgi:hypothetical protein
MAYLPLSTANLPDPAIDPAQGSSPEDYFIAKTWTGTGVARDIDIGMAPDLVWTKARNQSYDHNIFDSVRGVLEKLSSNSTAIESPMANSVTAFNDDGFSLGDTAQVNLNNSTFVSWNWKAPTSFSNSAGTNGATIASSGKVSTESGFSIVRFNSGASGMQSFKHGLDQRPDLCIFKEKDSGGAGDHWVVWEGVALNPAQSYGYLNLTNAFGNDASQWSNTAPTSSIFTYNSGYAWSTSQEMIAYCFHSVEGYSKVGSYSGGSDAFVYLGFAPAMIMMAHLCTQGLDQSG